MDRDEELQIYEILKPEQIVFELQSNRIDDKHPTSKKSQNASVPSHVRDQLQVVNISRLFEHLLGHHHLESGNLQIQSHLRSSLDVLTI
jgi:hypothetical protein